MTTNDPQDGAPGGDGPRVWPLYVRVMAVVYVLCQPGRWLVLFALAGAAVLLHGLGHPLDGLLIGLGLGGVGGFLAAEAYRWWFPRWGRKHWPPGSGDPDQP